MLFTGLGWSVKTVPSASVSGRTQDLSHSFSLYLRLIMIFTEQINPLAKKFKRCISVCLKVVSTVLISVVLV